MRARLKVSLKAWIKAMSRDERTKIARVLESVPRSAAVLEVGAGLGRKQALLKDLGFTDVSGVEASPEVAAQARQAGHAVWDLEQFWSERDAGRSPLDKVARPAWDVLVLAHIIEHFAYADLLAFMNEWLALVRPGGRVLIVTPVLGPHFYLDFDHVKPYYPHGLKTFFGKGGDQVQTRGRHVLRLLDVHFRRSPFKRKLSRSLLLKRGDTPALLGNLALAVLFKLSFGLVGRTTGWIGLYERK